MPTMFTKAEFAQLEEIAAEAVRTSQPIPSSPDYDATAVRLLAVAEQIDNDPDSFNMDAWATDEQGDDAYAEPDEISGVASNFCGTSCCIAGWLICFTPAGEVTETWWEEAGRMAAGFLDQWSDPLGREVFKQFETTPVQAVRRLRALATIPAPRTLHDARQLDGFRLCSSSDTEFERRAAQADRDADRDAGEAL